MQRNLSRANALRLALSIAAEACVVGLLGVAVPEPAHAQTVYCTNCSTAYTQAYQYAKELETRITQLQAYQTQINQYANMVTNTLALPAQVWATAQNDIMRVQALSNPGSLFSGNNAGYLSRLQNLQSYGNQAANLTSMPLQIVGYQRQMGNNLTSMGQALGIQQGQEASNAALLAALQQHSQSATGQMQALQASNELAHQNATQLLQIQATLNATAQMQGGQMAIQADRQAINDAAMMHFNSASQVATTGYASW